MVLLHIFLISQNYFLQYYLIHVFPYTTSCGLLEHAKQHCPNYQDLKSSSPIQVTFDIQLISKLASCSDCCEVCVSWATTWFKKTYNLSRSREIKKRERMGDDLSDHGPDLRHLRLTVIVTQSKIERHKRYTYCSNCNNWDTFLSFHISTQIE